MLSYNENTATYITLPIDVSHSFQFIAIVDATRLHDANILLFEEIDYGFFVLEAISKYNC